MQTRRAAAEKLGVTLHTALVRAVEEFEGRDTGRHAPDRRRLQPAPLVKKLRGARQRNAILDACPGLRSLAVRYCKLGTARKDAVRFYELDIANKLGTTAMPLQRWS